MTSISATTTSTFLTFSSSHTHQTLELCGARFLATGREAGDLRRSPEGLARRARLLSESWTTVRQVHGRAVCVVDAVSGHREQDADALVTTAADVPLAMLAADCALVGFASDEGVIGVAHAGWRGLVDGVLEATVTTMRGLGATAVRAVVSSMIHPECYEFSPSDLDEAAARFGPQVRGVTAGGQAAFDLPRGVAAALERLEVGVAATFGGCTSCEPGWFSWRARRDEGRHVLVVYRAAP
jgi:hypothetical protein